jgi:MFS family permease
VSTSGPDAVSEGLVAPAGPRTEPEDWRWFGRVRWLLLIAGLLAGLAAFGIGEKTHDLIPAEKVPEELAGNAVMLANVKTTTVAATRNGAITFGALGLCLAAGLGLAGGLARRSTVGMAAGGSLGALLGVAMGAGVTWALLPGFITARGDYFDYDLFISMGMHGLIWGLIGAAAGLAFAVGLGRYRLGALSLLAGLIGAVLASLAYDIIGAVCFAGADTDEPISETWPTRLMACLLVTLGAAIAVALSIPEPRPIGPAAQPEVPPPPRKSDENG